MSFDSDSDIDMPIPSRAQNNRRGRIDYDSLDEDLDEDEDEDGNQNHENDGFIIDDDEDLEEELESAPRRKHKKKRKSHSDEELDEDDLALLEENAGIRVERKGDKPRNKESYDYDDVNDEISEPEDSYKRAADRDSDGLGGMFDDDDEEIAGEQYSDDLLDFIDHDIPEEDEQEGIDEKEREERREISRKRHLESIRRMKEGGVDLEERELLYEIFGNGKDYEHAMFEKVEEKKVDPKETFGDMLVRMYDIKELEARMLTKKDMEIRSSEFPERLIERIELESKISSPDDNHSKKYDWILAKFFDPTTRASALARSSNQLQVKEILGNVLDFFNKNHFEVPYIWIYREDYLIDPDSSCNDIKRLVELGDLWYLFDLDLEYKEYYFSLKTFQDNLATFKKENRCDDYVIGMIESADCIEAVHDLYDYVNAMFYDPNASVRSKDKALRPRPVDTKIVEKFQQLKLNELVEQCGMSARNMGLNVEIGHNIYKPKDTEESPLVFAERFKSPMLPTAVSVLDFAITYMAHQLFHDLKIRRAFRNMFENNSQIAVAPTPQGIKDIDIQHRFFRFKYLGEKHVSSFSDESILLMLQAEKEGLVKIKVTMQNQQVFIKKIIDLYSSGNNQFESTVQWNKLRTKIIETTCYRHLLPFFEEWTKRKLRVRAEVYLGKMCQLEAESRFSMAPYKVDINSKSLSRVLAFTSNSAAHREPSVGILLDENGVVTDALDFGDLRDEASRNKVSRFMFESKPNVIVVSGFEVSTRMFFDRIRNLAQDTFLNGPSVEVFMHTDEVTRLYFNSELANEEFPGLLKLQRYCVSLARLVQEPLVEYAMLKDNLTNVMYHPNQIYLDPKVLASSIERALMNVVSSVGVNINKAKENPRIANLLQYLPGLGPRKAHHLMEKLGEVTTDINSRADAVTYHLAPKDVFQMAGGFICFPNSEEVLDATRIQEGDYELVRKMAADAIDADDDEDDLELVSQNVAELFRNPAKIMELDLDDYSRVLTERYRSQKKATLNLIRDEIHYPFKDHRNSFQSTKLESLFMQFSGETSTTLHVNMSVAVRIRRIKDRVVVCTLANGIDGILPMRFVPDPETLIEGAIITCAVVKINYERFSVDLSLVESDLKMCKQATLDHFGVGGFGVDSCFRHDLFMKESCETAREMAGLVSNLDQAQPKEKVNSQRTIEANPRARKMDVFKLFNFIQAQDFLANKPMGSLVMRPSSMGINYVAMAYKFYTDLYLHVIILEVANGSSFTYQIDEKSYNSLDEIKNDYLVKTTQHIQNMLNHPKFYKGSIQDLQDNINATSLAQPKQSIYGFCLSRERPGYFSLGFKLGVKSAFEVWSVQVVPTGYRLNRQEFPDVTHLVNGLKIMLSQKPSAQPFTNSNPHHPPPPNPYPNPPAFNPTQQHYQQQPSSQQQGQPPIHPSRMAHMEHHNPNNHHNPSTMYPDHQYR